MLYPSIDDLMEKVDSRYTLVIMASKRARQILEGDAPVVVSNSKKAVSIAVQEIAEGKVSYTAGEDEVLLGEEEAINTVLDIEEV